MFGKYRQKNFKFERCKQIVFIDFPNNFYCHHTSDNICKGPGNSKNNSTLGINHKTAATCWRMDKTSQCNSILSPIIVTLISCLYLSHLLNYVWSSASQQLTRRLIIFNLSFTQENIWTNHTYLQLTACISYIWTEISCISITNFWQNLMLTCSSIMLSHELAHWLCLTCHNGFLLWKLSVFLCHIPIDVLAWEMSFRYWIILNQTF